VSREIARCVGIFEHKGAAYEIGAPFDLAGVSVTERDMLVRQGLIEIEEVSDKPTERPSKKEVGDARARRKR